MLDNPKMPVFKDHDNSWLPCMISFDEPNITLGLSPSFYVDPGLGWLFGKSVPTGFWHEHMLHYWWDFWFCLYSSLRGAWILDLHNKMKVKKDKRNCSILIFRYGCCRKLSDYSHKTISAQTSRLHTWGVADIWQCRLNIGNVGLESLWVQS